MSSRPEPGPDSGRDVEHEAVIRQTFGTIDRWRAIPGPFIPGSGSELKGDDWDWPPCGVSQVAWTGLTVAVEHLQAVRTHIDVQPPNHASLFVFAHQTLARSALVGASMAVWVLVSDARSTRVERARSAVTYMQDEHAKYLRALQDLAQHDRTDAVAAHVNQRQAELKAKRQRDGQVARFETTKMIREAALDAFKSRDLANEVVAAWRSGSGAAHGLPFPVFGRPGMVQAGPGDSDGVATFVVSGEFSQFSNAYMAAFKLATIGWELLFRRGQ